MQIIRLNKNFKKSKVKESKDYRQYKRMFCKSHQGGLSNKIKDEYEKAHNKK